MFHFIKKCFSGIWKTLRFIRECLLNIVVFGLLIVFLSVFVVVKNTQNIANKSLENAPKNQNILVLNLTGTIVEQKNYNSLSLLTSSFSQTFGNNTENSLYDIVEIISVAAQDPQIKGLVLQLDEFDGASLPTLQYVGKYLDEFKSTGKKIYAIGQNYTTARYYLASFADKIYLQPQGSVNLLGFSAHNLFYKQLLDNLNIETHIFRVGTYKSAVEPMMRNDMSPEAKENLSRWLNHMWQSYLHDVAINRHLSTTELTPQSDVFIERLKTANQNGSHYELDYHLVDQITTYPEFWKLMREEFGQDALTKNDAFLDMYTYFANVNANNKVKPVQSNAPEIAVIIASGSIVNEASSPNDIDPNALIAQIQQARRDPNIKAVVFRVNSPGGSVTASELIRNELQALHETGKKIVVSMGSMAASGGYWISTVSDKIIASSNTITGSIGVFGVIPNFEKALNHFGVFSDGVSTSSLSDIGVTQALTDEQKAMMQLSVEKTYGDFLSIVAKSRHKTPAEINQIAQGQVWIGQDALKNGLVDELGDFDDAVDAAAKLANLDNFELNWLEPEKTVVEKVIDYFTQQTNNVALALLPKQLTQINNYVVKNSALLTQFDDPKYNYVYCLNCASIE